jgi:Uncharacterized protein conserved in bacteria
MTPPQISLDTAQSLSLHAQELLHPTGQPGRKEDVLATIQRNGVWQIDTINIVARSPYLALWSRLGNYDMAWLDELLAEGRLFEYWAHAACFIPIEQYPYHRRMMLERQHHHRYAEWYQEHQADTDAVLRYVQEHGAVRSADFERKDGKKGTWWDWKIEKDALEHWLAVGELMVARREKFQRVYDLRERVLPNWHDDNVPTLEECVHFFTRTSVQALGIAQRDWVADFYRLPKASVAKAIEKLLAEGALSEIQVEGWAEPALVPSETLTLLEDPAVNLTPTFTTLLSPFDTLIWDRKRARQMFDYDFSIECYLPAPKRKYGYYLLSVLHRGRLVARLDAKAHRQEGRFEVKSFYWEAGVTPTPDMLSDIRAAMQSCADWHKTPELCLPDSFVQAS